MKYIYSLAALVLFAALSGPAYALPNNSYGCEKKEQALMQQLEIAREYGNYNQIRGLERALANVRTWCSDGGLLSDAEENVEEKQEEVWEREQELAEAIAEGKDPEKIAKRQRKLDEARNELEQAVRERDALLGSKR